MGSSIVRKLLVSVVAVNLFGLVVLTVAARDVDNCTKISSQDTLNGHPVGISQAREIKNPLIDQLTKGNPLMEQLTKGNPLMDQLTKNNPMAPLMKPFTDQMTNSGMGALFGLGRKDEEKKKDLEEIMPTHETTSISTPTLTPLEQLTKSLSNPLALTLPGTKLLEGSSQALNSVIASPVNPVNIATQGIPKVIENTGKIVSSLSGTGMKGRPDDESAYYELRPGGEPFEYRRPKYFSYDCQFRFACEFGRAIRPLTATLYKTLINNKIFQDLQNRYTRAMTYGTLYDDCERYYCLLIQFVGGPDKFARGVAELVNRVANPEMYDGVLT